MTDDPHGAYGLRIRGIESAHHLLNPVPADWPEITVRQAIGETAPPKNTIDDEVATMPFITGGGAVITRATDEAVVTVPEPLTPEEIAHPYLAPIASVFAHWRGWIPFHAGGVVIGDVAWGIVGAREAGKSTLTAALALRGLPVLTDDVFVIDEERHAYAGPRTLDLRETAADHFGVGRDLGIVGMRERWRFDLDPAPLRVRHGGWIFPAWGDDLEISECAAGDRLRALAPGRTVLSSNIDGGLMLKLITVPSITFTRPRRWDAMDESLDALLETVTSPAGSGVL